VQIERRLAAAARAKQRAEELLGALRANAAAERKQLGDQAATRGERLLLLRVLQALAGRCLALELRARGGRLGAQRACMPASAWLSFSEPIRHVAGAHSTISRMSGQREPDSSIGLALGSGTARNQRRCAAASYLGAQRHAERLLDSPACRRMTGGAAELQFTAAALPRPSCRMCARMRAQPTRGGVFLRH